MACRLAQVLVGKSGSKLLPADFMPMTEEEREAVRAKQNWQQQLAAMETLAALARLAGPEKP